LVARRSERRRAAGSSRDRRIDGDTIVVAFADGSTDTIRLLGVDTPKVA